jgi:hypothetical protein
MGWNKQAICLTTAEDAFTGAKRNEIEEWE